MIFGSVAIIGGIIVVICTLIILGRRFIQPNKELKEKVQNLERELKSLKDNK